MITLQTIFDINRGLSKVLFFALIILILVSPGPVYPSSVVISDNRVENLNGYPTVGRGYSMFSNRLLSMCFKSIKKSLPTFDLNYEMKHVDRSFLKNIHRHFSEMDKISRSKVHSFISKYFADEEKEGTRTYRMSNLIVILNIKSYYYSLDETGSELSDSVINLLDNDQYLTFFNSCGHFYVRAAGSFSTYFALIQYRQRGNLKEDEDFLKNLEKGLFNFNAGEEKNVSLSQVKSDAGYRGLRVYVQGTGLSKREETITNLLPLDIAQFRTTMQDVVKLMQNPDAGIINSIEVVPWMENPQLSAKIMKSLLIKKLSETSKKTGGSAEKTDEKGAGPAENKAGSNDKNDEYAQYDFIKQQRLIENTGVITEINHISQEQMDTYHVANMCLKNLFEKYIDEDILKEYNRMKKIKTEAKKYTDITEIIDANKIQKYDATKTMFYNQTVEGDENKFISLQDFINYFAQTPPATFFHLNEEYLKGRNVTEMIKGKAVTRFQPGALDCIKIILEKGLENADYRKYPVCIRALEPKKFDDEFIDQYCLPKPAKIIYKGDRERETGDTKGKNDSEAGERDRNYRDGGNKEKKYERIEDLLDKSEKKKKTEREDNSGENNSIPADEQKDDSKTKEINKSEEAPDGGDTSGKAHELKANTDDIHKKPAGEIKGEKKRKKPVEEDRKTIPGSDENDGKNNGSDVKKPDGVKKASEIIKDVIDELK